MRRLMEVFLKTAGHAVNRKRVKRQMGLVGMSPGPGTNQPHPGPRYTAAARFGDGPPQSGVEHGYHVHLAGPWLCLSGGAIIDWYSRKVLDWWISNSLGAVFCKDCLKEALRNHGRPEVLTGAET